MKTSLPIVVLVGSTATGKSTGAIDLALSYQTLGQPAEIINADSMLVYRGMDIGTAKPTHSERRGITHHLIDIQDINEEASVAQFQKLAREAISQCRDKSILPIVVGGSALYLHAVIDSVEFPPTDQEVRARLVEEMDVHGVEKMYQKLQKLSPQAAQGINPGNDRRIIRALEAIELTGEFTSTLPVWDYALDGVQLIGLDIDRDTMDARIAQRVEHMFEMGFTQEVRQLLDQGLRESPTASRAIGYRQVIAYLDGEITETQARELTIIKTRQFSRKQIAWWKRDPRITWVPYTTTTDELRAMIAQSSNPALIV
ncbi:MAG: tRNA (adenosine(37)-N6)-dimethylallyltransferase MiaA [Propionibacteriaceae bacterium]|nr:tRNA (adenosine(37)-N6)-dimethylallyltransferase MiaA [Propionibacteriaceae bacterium]